MNIRTIGLLTLLIGLIFFTITVLANVKAERIKVNLKESCIEKVIEVAETVDGVIQTEWNEESKELEIIFEDDKTNLEEIEKAISEAGFDTPNFKAPNKSSITVTGDCGEDKPAE